MSAVATRAPKLELVPIDALEPHPANPNEGDVGAICDLIVHNGWFGQTLVQVRDDSPDRIFVGEHRWRALRMLQAQGGVVRENGTETPLDYPALQARAEALDLPALPPPGKCWVQRYPISDRLARRHMLADNRAHDLASYDDQQLAALLREIADEDGLVGTGFDDEALDELLRDLAVDRPKASDAVPDLPENPVTRQGDMIVLGEHVLLCGDSCDPESYARLLNGEQAELCLTDPPYGNDTAYATYEDTPENLVTIVARAMPCILKHAKVAMLTPGVGNMYRYPAPKWVLCWPISAGAGAGSGPWGFALWQPILAYGPDPYLAAGLGRRPDTHITHSLPASSDGHPCAKPIEIWSWLLIRGSIAAGDLVLDPFAGSGTTLMACEQEGRRARCIEIDPGYCDVIVERWEAHTGRKAERP